MALHEAGFVGNYIQLREVWLQIVKKPHIRKALKLRVSYMMKKSDFSVVIGDNEADGNHLN